jgi:hypothetical protein
MVIDDLRRRRALQGDSEGRIRQVKVKSGRNYDYKLESAILPIFEVIKCVLKIISQ